MINVTESYFPPIEEYHQQLQRIWNNKWLTNRGELVQELEQKLKEYLSISNILLMNNGTIPLQISLKILGRGGEIITTPFSYIATSSAIVWENCTPIFVDICPDYLTIDESKIESAITAKTTCILATHVFGNPCNVEAIEKIAAKYNLKVIYDAAHAFGVTYNDKSIFEYGDVSTCSFHATKLFHSGEGGALFSNDPNLRDQAYYSHNFGHKGQLEYHGLGINAKMSELHAGMGLAVLPHMKSILKERRKVCKYYEEHLHFSKFKSLRLRQKTKWNYSYYPIIFETESQLLQILTVLNNQRIFPRRYFYPSLNTIEYLKGGVMPNSEKIASRVLCLPLAAQMKLSDVKRICDLINNTII